MSNFVFVLDTDKRPLDPIHPAQARLVLTKKKAAVFRRYPFTIILKESCPDVPVTQLELKLDPGSKTTGLAILLNNKLVWAAELTHRGQEIKNALLHRKQIRRGRRQRNTRYRQPRFLNRKRSEKWLPPSLQHRVLTIMTWVNRMTKLAPIYNIAQELVKFDLQKLENPEISGIEYQQGILQGYEVREYLLEKFERKCVYCGETNTQLQVEHIHPKSKGGSDRISNLTIACTQCNQNKGNQDIKDFLSGQPDLLKRILVQAKTPLKDATAVNATRWQLFRTLHTTGLPITTGSGGQTKFNRTRLSLPKQHYVDAACVGNVDKLQFLTTNPLVITCKGHGGRQRCQPDKYGYPQKHRPLRPIHGFSTGDMVRAEVPTGKYKGTFTARVCPMSDGRGEFVINKKRRSINLKYCQPIHRKDGYDYRWLRA